MHLDIVRTRREARPGRALAYVIAATLHVSAQERRDLETHGLADHPIETETEQEHELPAQELLAGREFVFDTAREALDFEESLVAACSDFADLLTDSIEFGGSERYELPLDVEDEDDEDDDR
jgi:hypothetical protein